MQLSPRYTRFQAQDLSCYTDIIHLDKTGIMGLSSTLGLAKTLAEILHEIVGLNPIIFGCKCGCVRISIAGRNETSTISE